MGIRDIPDSLEEMRAWAKVSQTLGAQPLDKFLMLSTALVGL